MKVEMNLTTFKNKKLLTEKKTFDFVEDTGLENEAINIYPSMKYQKLEGFGGALTDSAGYMYSIMPDELKTEMLEEYYKPENMNYRFARTHIDSCDFSVDQYEAMSDASDVEMKSFDITRVGKYIFPLLDDVQKACDGPIHIMVTPWSPPLFMKTNGERIHGGELKPEYRAFWAEYICRYIREFKGKGYKVTRMSLQNEPNATQTWDSCRYTGQQEKEFLRDFMYPALVKNKLEDIEIFIWDHNKERAFERACQIIDDETDKMVAGLAFHWYSGDHFGALKLIREKFPDKLLIMSEACIEYSKFGGEDSIVNAQKYAHEIIGGLNNGMNGFYDWNIVLDETGGPNHVGNFCDAPFLYDTKTKKLIRRNSLKYIYHFSHYMKPDSVMIATTTYTDKIEAAAWESPDGELTAVMLNRTEEPIPVALRVNGEYAKIIVEPQSIATCVILD